MAREPIGVVLQADRCVKGMEFGALKLPKRAWLLLGEMQWPDAGPHEICHGKADGVEHAAHDPIAPLVDDELDHGTSRNLPDDPNPVARCAAVLEVDTTFQLAQGFAGDRPLDGGDVFLVDLMRRVPEPIRELAVIREYEQAFSVGVEAADVEEALLTVCHQVSDARASMLVRHRRDDPSRLVQRQHHHARCRGNPRTVHVNDVSRGVDAGTKINDLPVDGHPTVGDQPLAPAPAADARSREHLLKANPFVHLLPAGHGIKDVVQIRKIGQVIGHRRQLIKRGDPEPLKEVRSRAIEHRI
jgi:hypothetical protein